MEENEKFSEKTVTKILSQRFARDWIWFNQLKPQNQLENKNFQAKTPFQSSRRILLFQKYTWMDLKACTDGQLWLEWNYTNKYQVMARIV